MPLSVNTVELPMVCAVPRTFREAILSKSHVHGGAPGAGNRTDLREGLC